MQAAYGGGGGGHSCFEVMGVSARTATRKYTGPAGKGGQTVPELDKLWPMFRAKKDTFLTKCRKKMNLDKMLSKMGSFGERLSKKKGGQWVTAS